MLSFTEKMAISLLVFVLFLCLNVVVRTTEYGYPKVDTSDLRNIVEGVIGNSVFFAFGIVAANFGRIRRVARARSRVQSANESSFATSSLMVISGSRYELTKAQLVMRILDEDFRIGVPESIRESLLEASPDFLFNESVIFPRVTRLIEATKHDHPTIEDVLRRSTLEVGREFVERARRSERLFNGNLLHVFTIGNSATVDEKEEPTVSIDFYRVDYFTHQVVSKAFKIASAESGLLRSAVSKGQMTNSLRLFLNGFGLCCLVCAIPDRSRGLDNAFLVFGRRSERVAKNQATGTWHVTANEALSQTDIEDQRISIDRWIRRALHEGVGVTEDQIIRSFLFNVFIAFSEMQPGICCLSFCEMPMSLVESKVSSSQDGALEYDAYCYLAFDDKSIDKALRDRGIEHKGQLVSFSPTSENILRNIIARGTKNLIP